ncbi:MAG: DUF4249 family protein [Salinibacter sp.]
MIRFLSASAVGRALLAVGLVLGLARCDWSTTPVEEESLVVEAFLETGRPLPPVLLRRTRPLRAGSDSLADRVSGAQVTVQLDGTRYPYEEAPGTPGRYRSPAEAVVPPGTPWRLTVRWEGNTARARGKTPAPIDIRTVCVDVPDAPARAVQVDSLRRDSLDIPADLGYIYPMDVTVRWTGPRGAPRADTSTWVRAQLRPDATPFPSEVVEFFLQPAQVRREDTYTRRNGAYQWRGVYAVPVDSAEAPLPPHNVTTALVRGDTAFAAFARTRTDPGRREPISNVEGGLGIAVAVSVDSLVRSVEPGMVRCQPAPEPGGS